MPEDKDGGTSDPKTYSEDEVKTLVEAATETANKEGATKSWSHFQGVADKQISDAKNEGTAREAELTNTINTMKAAHIESLPESERTAAMVEELYKDRAGVNKPSAPAPDSKTTVKESQVSNGDYEKQMQATIGGHLKELGLDPAKVSWGEGLSGDESLKTFLASVVAQAKAEKSGGEEKKEDPDAKTGENNVDTSRGAGNSVDINTISPQALMAQDGAWKPIRGMEE